MMAKKKQTKKKTTPIALIISLLIVLVIYLINRLVFVRPIMWLVAIIFFVIYLKQYYKMTVKQTLTSIIILFFVSIVLDGIIVTVFKRIPAFTYNVVSSEKVNIYYSPGLRVWQCDKNSYKNLIIDQFYNKGYVCDANDIVTVDSNSFLNSVIENFDDYHNQYVKINGKISKKNSQKSIEMRPYIESEVKVNGYVEFSNSIVLKIFFTENAKELDEYDVYDDITILGLVKNIEGETGNYIVYMDNAKVLSNNSLTNFDISINPEARCSSKKLLAISADKELYSYCLKEIFVSYAENTSELIDILSSNKLEIPDLYKNYSKIESDDKGNKMYRLDNYSVLVCNSENSKDIIIGKKNMNFTDTECSIYEES